MSTTPSDEHEHEGPVPAPSAARFDALPSDVWGWLLPHVRAALHALEGNDQTAAVQRLRAAPTGKLAGGRSRRELATVLAGGGPAWRALVARLDATTPPPPVDRLLRGAPEPPAPSQPPPTGSAGTTGTTGTAGTTGTTGTADIAGTAAAGRDDAEVTRLRGRLREIRGERDELRRRLDGAQARAVALEQQVADLDADLAAGAEARTELERQLATAAGDRRRAVERERRRRDAEIARLEAQAADLRRADEQRRVDQRRREESRRAAAAATRAAERAAQREAEIAAAPARLVPGRPSRLPAGVDLATTEGVELLLHPGRLVLVDGYNVTKRRHPDLGIEAQRTWLVQALASLAARRRVRPVAVFDGERAAGHRAPIGGRDVEVRFTPDGVTADDELVLAAEATDEPIVAVTDDRELTGRLTAVGVDVVAAQPFLWALR